MRTGKKPRRLGKESRSAFGRCFRQSFLARSLTAWGSKLAILSQCAIGCSLPPAPPEAGDLTSDWMRQQSVSTRSASQLTASRNREGVATDLATDCDKSPTWFDQDLGAEHSAMDRFVAEVLSVNHDFEAAEASWRAAMELYPQATSWDDPRFRFQNGPMIFGDSQGQQFWRIQLGQHVPWFGKTGLRGELADRSADVAHYQWRQMRQDLVGLARSTYLDYVKSEQLHELQQADYMLAKSVIDPPSPHRQVAHATGASHNREALELDMLELEEQRREIDLKRQLARERLNALRHRPVDAETPVETPPFPEIPDFESLRQAALRQNPQLAVTRYREKQAETKLRLAEKDFYPDFMLTARFDSVASSLWAPDSVNLRPQILVEFDPPVRQGRRWAKHREMRQLVRQRNAETQSSIAKVENDIKSKLAAIQRSETQLDLLDRLIVAAEQKSQKQHSLVSTGGEELMAHVEARRAVLKYRMKKTEAKFERLQQFNDLAQLTGQDSWVGEDPAAAEGEWNSTIPFLSVFTSSDRSDTGFGPPPLLPVAVSRPPESVRDQSVPDQSAVELTISAPENRVRMVNEVHRAMPGEAEAGTAEEKTTEE